MVHEQYLINYLRNKCNFYDPSLPPDKQIRAMINVTLPYHLSDEFYDKQDEYLTALLKTKKVVYASRMHFHDNIALHKGDITLIKADAVVNAGNSALLGCFAPLHYCIDNAIHSFAGLQVRRDLMNILGGQEIKNGEVVLTRGYNLPAKYIFHTVGPIYQGIKKDEIDLALCYINCLQKADELHLSNIVFCSLSTGVFGFPIEQACKIAIKTVRNYLKKHHTDLKVVFDVFSDSDYQVYERNLREN